MRGYGICRGTALPTARWHRGSCRPARTAGESRESSEMKRVLLASASALMLAAVALPAAAADLPRRAAPAPVAPAYVVAVYNWTGFYVGAHVGWGRVDLSSTVVAPAGLGGIGT